MNNEIPPSTTSAPIAITIAAAAAEPAAGPSGRGRGRPESVAWWSASSRSGPAGAGRPRVEHGLVAPVPDPGRRSRTRAPAPRRERRAPAGHEASVPRPPPPLRRQRLLHRRRLRRFDVGMLVGDVLLVVDALGVDRPDVVVGAEQDVVDRAHRGQHRVIGVVVAMQAVAPDLDQVGDPLEPAPDRRHALGVLGVVDRIGLVHAHHEAELDLLGPWPARAAGSPAWPSRPGPRRPCSTARRPRSRSTPSRSRRRCRSGPSTGSRSGSSGSAPPARRVVDVDPVVGEQVLALDHERDGEEVPVAQAARGVADLDRAPRAR